jgi:hypothetical protein
MYSFAQRSDTCVYDEPLYGYYLANTGADAYHPGATEILKTMELDGDRVVDMMLGEHKKPVAFFKGMTHHLLDLDRGFMKRMVNIILTRNPRDMLLSFSKVIKEPSMSDVGYAAQLDLFKDLEAMDARVVVIDSKKILENPEKELKALCTFMEIPFERSMLQWQAGPRPEDGIWAKYWYQSVHQSRGFRATGRSDQQLPNHLHSLLNECVSCYEELMSLSI